MGLDMYLYLKKHEYNSDYRNPESCNYPDILSNMERQIKNRNFRMIISDTKYLVGYWRKFNALHNLIVKKYADGVDKCQEIDLNTENIKTIIGICEEILKDHSLAKELLPTSNGFFFGSQEYDEWYFKDIEYTLSLFKDILDTVSKENYSIIYQASW